MVTIRDVQVVRGRQCILVGVIVVGAYQVGGGVGRRGRCRRTGKAEKQTDLGYFWFD